MQLVLLANDNKELYNGLLNKLKCVGVDINFYNQTHSDENLYKVLLTQLKILLSQKHPIILWNGPCETFREKKVLTTLALKAKYRIVNVDNFSQKSIIDQEQDSEEIETIIRKREDDG